MSLFYLNNLESVDKIQAMLFITLIITSVFLFTSMLFVIFTKLKVAITYKKYNNIQCQKGDTAFDLTNENLSHLNLKNIQVKKASFMRSLLGLNMQGYGNSYSAYKKTIYLRKNIINKSSITAYAVSTQKVAHAAFDNEKKHQFYYKFKPFMIFAPSMFIPLIVLGVFLDITMGSGLGIYTIIFTILSLIIFVACFVILLTTIPIEKKANKKSEKILIEFKSVTDEEMVGIKKVNKAYILSYIADFVYSLLQIVWDILKLLLNVASKKRK